MIKHLLVYLILSLPLLAYSQADGDVDDFRDYLEDGERSDADANIQWAPTSLLNGFLDFHYEHKINDFFSMQVGGGPKVSIGVDDLLFGDHMMSLTPDIVEVRGGRGFSLALKLYPSHRAITNMGYTALVIRSRKSNYFSDETFAYTGNWSHTSTDIYFATGLKYIFSSVVSADLSTGVGARLNYLSFDESGVYESQGLAKVMATVELKLGYYIKY